jgi:hypothetical protein
MRAQYLRCVAPASLLTLSVGEHRGRGLNTSVLLQPVPSRTEYRSFEALLTFSNKGSIPQMCRAGCKIGEGSIPQIWSYLVRSGLNTANVAHRSSLLTSVHRATRDVKAQYRKFQAPREDPGLPVEFGLPRARSPRGSTLGGSFWAERRVFLSERRRAFVCGEDSRRFF